MVVPSDQNVFAAPRLLFLNQVRYLWILLGMDLVVFQDISRTGLFFIASVVPIFYKRRF